MTCILSIRVIAPNVVSVFSFSLYFIFSCTCAVLSVPSLSSCFSRPCLPPPPLEVELLDIIGTKVLGVFLLAIHSHLYKQFYPPPLSKSGLKLVCNVNIVYGSLKPDNSYV
jgi:hypothetical protein